MHFSAIQGDRANANVPKKVDGRSLVKAILAKPRHQRGRILVEHKWTTVSQFGNPTPPVQDGSHQRARLHRERYRRERELYDLGADPYQLDNLAGQRPELEAELEHRLNAMRNCKAQGCRAAERL